MIAFNINSFEKKNFVTGQTSISTASWNRNLLPTLLLTWLITDIVRWDVRSIETLLNNKYARTIKVSQL